MAHAKMYVSSPGRMVLFSIILLIMVGTLLISLPSAVQNPDIPLLDRVFTSASAVCVTGLLTVPLDQFTTFGHVILLILIQIGGLGFITLTVFLLSFFVELGLGTHLMMGQLLEIDRYKSSRYMIGFIIVFTSIVELIGAFLLFFTLPSEFSVGQRAFYALFHSVSSFCSSGFVIFPQGIGAFAFNAPFLLITTFLMLVGELGFIVWHDVLMYIRSSYYHKPFRFSLHSRIVFSVTTILILFSGFMIWLLEHNHSFKGTSFFISLVNVIFNTVSYRSTGFTTLNIATIHLATFFLIMVIAFIGSSPGSTGSGIKTTTFAIYIAAIKSVLSGRTFVALKGRTIPTDQVFKAMAVLSLSLAWLALITFCLLVTEEGWRFVDIIFESFSAFANLGLSADLTPHLSYLGKMLVIVSMMIGRIGSLTLILAFKRKTERTGFYYPEERVLIS